MVKPTASSILQLPRSPSPPKHLSGESKRRWKQVVSNWEIDEGGLPLLEQALEALDRLRQAQEMLAKEGLVAKGRNNEDIVHPAYRIEKAARQQFLTAWKMLDLELPDELPLKVGRPPGGRRR